MAVVRILAVMNLNPMWTSRESTPMFVLTPATHGMDYWIKEETNVYWSREQEREGRDGVVLHRVLYPNAHENGFKKLN